MMWSRIIWASSTGPYSSEATTNETSAIFDNLPPPKPAKPITFTPKCFAASTAAMMFGEFYPNPGCTAHVSFALALFAEALGTFLLVLMIFALTEGCNVGRPDDALAPVFIGLTVTSVICLIGPLTQAGLNPARDLGPRLVAWLMGWGDAAFPDRAGGFFFVYMLSPVVGAVAASRYFVSVLEPAMRDTAGGCDCKGGTCS